MLGHFLHGALCWEPSPWCWLRMAATKLFPGRAIRDAPRLLDTSEAWETDEEMRDGDHTWQPSRHLLRPSGPKPQPCDLSPSPRGGGGGQGGYTNSCSWGRPWREERDGRLIWLGTR